MKTMHYPNKIKFHFVTIVPMTSFTPNSTLNLRFALYFRDSIVIPGFIPALVLFNPNNHYNHSFPKTFDYNQFINSDYLLCTETASARIIR